MDDLKYEIEKLVGVAFECGRLSVASSCSVAGGDGNSTSEAQSLSVQSADFTLGELKAMQYVMEEHQRHSPCTWRDCVSAFAKVKKIIARES